MTLEAASPPLAWPDQTKPEFCAPHPKNRKGHGVGGSESQWHGRDVLAGGFSWKKASDACAVEVPPPPFDKEATESSDKLVKLSQGLTPPLLMLKLLSIGGATTNCFLRQVKAECRCVVPKLADANGKFNKEMLCLGRPSFAEALEKGLRWIVLHWMVPFVWPELVDFGQSALNVHAKGALT